MCAFQKCELQYFQFDNKIEIDGSNQIWIKVMQSLIQKIKILISVTWPFEKYGLQYFQFDIF